MAEYDLFVIGGGSGGVACARRAASYGAKVGLAENSRMGGTCVIRGCVPKKLMHYGAHFNEMFKAAKSYGWMGQAPELDFEKLLTARNKEIARLNGIYISMLQKAGVTIHAGTAEIAKGREGAHAIVVDGERHIAKHVVIAVGAKPAFPDVPGIEHAVTSDHILEDIYALPNKLVVVGAGYIGVELASIFNGLGVETTLVLRGDLPLRGFDGELRNKLTVELENHGLQIRPKTEIRLIEKAGDQIKLQTNVGPIECDKVVYATGRKPIPNTKNIGLEELGVRVNGDGAIYVNTHYESNVDGIIAVGDCSDHAGHGLDSGHHDLTPVAIAEGRAVAERLFNNNTISVAYDTIPTAVFGMPQVGSVGLDEDQARSLSYDVEIYKTDFKPMLHTLTNMDRRIFMKLVVDKSTSEVIGCHLVGDEAAEIIQGFAVAMTAGALKSHFDDTVALHPSAAEEFVTMYQPATQM